ncbi:MAG: DNA primase [Betaproteobacteria bacterium]|nr:DNA primase [Betaproteobacteria bacterium]
MIPQSFIQDLLARVDIVDVIERYLPLKKGGVNYFANCPFHSEKSASFSVSPSKQFYHCFGCGAHGSAIGFLMQYNGLTYVEAIRELAREAGIQVPEDGRSASRTDDNIERLVEIMTAASKFYRETLEHAPGAAAYLRKRGLSPEVAARFGIGFAPDAQTSLQRVFPDYRDKLLNSAGLVIDNDQGRRYDRFRNRIMFPIHDRRGRVIAFGGRILENGEPKYLNSPETPLFEKGRELYGFFLAQKAIRAAGFALVVEGYMDVVALAQFGMENAVATLGTATTPHHIQTLLRQTNRVVFCFDGDEAGRHAAWRALENALDVLRDDVTLAFLFLPFDHDPDTFIREKGLDAMREAATNATPLASFLLDTLKQRCDTTSAEGRARLIFEARPLITRIPEAASILRLQLIKTLASASRMTQDEVEQALGFARRTDAGVTHSAYGSRQPPLTRRSPPSTTSTLLRLVLQHPALAARLPINLIPDNTDEGRALIAIIDLVELGESVTGLGALSERFRDTPHGDTLNRIATNLIETEFDPSAIEPLFEDTLRKLKASAIAQEISELGEHMRAGTLSSSGQRHLADLLKEKNTLLSFTKAPDS